MFDLREQLAQYLDQVIERPELEEVLAGRTEPRLPEIRRRTVPRWAYVIGATAAVLLLVGAPVWLLRADPQGEADTRSTTMAEPTSTSSAVPDLAVTPQVADTVFPLGSAVYAVAATDEIVVAVGTDEGGYSRELLEPEASAAVWVSTDGENWMRVPHDESVFGGPGGQVMWSVAVTPDGFVAAGTDGSSVRLGTSPDWTPQRAAVWTSPDGVAWTRSPDPDAVFDGPGRQEIFSVASSGSTIVAVGFDEEGPMQGSNEDTALWLSTDSGPWIQVPPGFGPGSMEVVLPSADGFVGLGVDNGRVAWQSTDGRVWSSMPGTGPDGLFFRAIIEDEAGYLAVEDGRGLWRSGDGVDWEPEAQNSSLLPAGELWGLTRFRDGYVGGGVRGPAGEHRGIAVPVLTGESDAVESLEAPASDAGLISPQQWTIAAVRFDLPADAADRIRGWEEVVDMVEMPPTWEAWVAVTGMDSMCLGDGPLPCQPGVVLLLSPDEDATSIAARLQSEFEVVTWLSPDVTQQLLNSYVNAFGPDRAHPQPAFDTGALGDELTLSDLNDAPDLRPQFTEPAELERPWFVAAALEGSDIIGRFWIETWEGPEAALGPVLRIEVDPAGQGSGSPLAYLYEPGGLITQGGGVYAIGGLPAATSVVATELSDGSGLWQRPIGGLALFKASAGMTGQFVALDESGAELLTFSVPREG